MGMLKKGKRTNMAIKVDKWIKEMSENQQMKMISPFVDKTVEQNVISYGLSSAGYDIRLGTTFLRLKQGNKVVDPKQNDEQDWDVIETSYPYIIHPQDYVLGCSVETFRIPDDTMVLVIGKSTYARSGLMINVTPGEPGWEGQWTLEFSNPTRRPIKLYPNEGIAQCMFFQSNENCDISYKSKNGKYQSQTGVTLARIKQ